MHGYASVEEAVREIDNVAEQLYVEPERRKMFIDTALKTDGFVKAEVHYRKKDGSTFWGGLYCRVVRDREGDVKHLEGFVSDITERKTAKEELQAALQRFYTILSNLWEGLLLVTEDGRIEFANQAFCDLFELDVPPANLHGLSPMEMIQKIQHIYAQPTKAVTRINEIVAQKRPVKAEEIAIRGGRTYVRDFIPILVDGKPYGRIWHQRDITEQKRSEGQIKASLREKEVLLREIHHRVKNNLAVIQSLLRIQSHYVKNEELSQVLEEIRHRIRSMALGHELLYQSENLSDIRISQYFGNLLSQLKKSFSIIGKRIEIRQEIEDLQLGIDKAVPLGFILTELISNCYKHAFPERSHGQIAVSLRYVGHENLELVVRDDGIGLPKDMDSEEPTSLGYHLIGIFVEQLNGEIEILSQKGTEVRISFPLK